MIYTITAFLLLISSLTVWRYNLLDISSDVKLHKSSNSYFYWVLYFCVIWLVFLEGLRWEIGTDWSYYYDFFLYQDNEHMGLGYKVFVNLVRLFTSNYSLFLILFAIITYATIANTALKFSVNPLASICIYYCSMLGLLGCNRQLLACFICINSLYFIQKRKLLIFMLIVLLASLVHITAIIFLPAYFIFWNDSSKKTMLSVPLICLLIGISHFVEQIPYIEYLTVLDYLSSNQSSFTSYVGAYTQDISLMGTLKRLFFVYFAIFSLKHVKSPYYKNILMLYIIGVSIYLCFNGSKIQLIAGRGATYYDIYEFIIIPTTIYYLPISNLLKKLIWVIFFFVYFYLMWRNINSYYLLDGIDIYNPYKCILFN